MYSIGSRATAASAPSPRPAIAKVVAHCSMAASAAVMFSRFWLAAVATSRSASHDEQQQMLAAVAGH
jgi:hypothetical protein